ncbi:MAG: hypothetical protein K8S62_08720 [Candidatus Sabulitectum sp.]|nr:hypothetical protein [Candidatus Sabulitectum sp.]
MYMALVRDPGSTGYKVAKALGKPVPNTYKILETLEAGGAVLLDDSGKSRLYSALPIKEYINQQIYSLKDTGEKLSKELQNLSTAPPEEGVYRLVNVNQVYAKAAAMIASAKFNLLIDADTLPMGRLREPIEAAASRGVTVLLHCHDEDSTFEGCDIIRSCKLDWPGDWLVVLVDGIEYLISILAEGEAYVHQAVWSKNPFIAPCIYQGYLNKAMLYRITLMFGEKPTLELVKAELDRLWINYGVDDPGTVALMKLLKSL